MAIDYSEYMAGMTATPLPSAEEIKKRYLTAIETNRAKNQALAEAKKQTVKDGISTLNQKYRDTLNDTYLSAAKTKKINAENLANMGLGSAGGTSHMLSGEADTKLLKDVGSLEREKAADISAAQNKIGEIDAAYAAKDVSFEQDASNSMASELKKAKERIYSVALALLNKKYITKKQFENMTGLSITASSPSSSSSSGKAKSPSASLLNKFSKVTVATGDKK